MDSAGPTELQLDALREVANVGCGQAANALSRLVGGRTITIEVPTAKVVVADDLELELSGLEGPIVAASLRLEGDLKGDLRLALAEGGTLALCGMLLPSVPTEIGEACRAAFAEVANILGSACLNAIGQLTGLKLFPSVPMVEQESAGELADWTMATVRRGGGYGVVLEARLCALDEPSLSGVLLLIPERQSLKRLLEKLGV